MRSFSAIALGLVFVVSCARHAPDPTVPPVDGNAIKAHIRSLASDQMEGRAPGGKGEELATAYIGDFFKSIGLKTQFQPVPLVGVTSTVSPLKLTGKGGVRNLKPGDEFMGWSKQQKDSIPVAGDLVFCGYGVVAPEYQWNDFKDSVKGKIIVVLINDPQLEDQSKFGGKAMTYYGRWTYKFEEAARQGAAGALIIHETPFAGYGWEVVRGSWSGEQFDIVRSDKGGSTVPLQGWLTKDIAASLFKSAGMDFDELKKKALQPDFRPIPLGISAAIDIHNKMRTVDSKNVIGVLDGSEKPDEYVIFTAHWDHLGVGEPQNGDKIYNGAVDNASGVATIMEIARAAAKIQPRPKRSFVFLAVTAEEQGLLGSAYYAEHPVFPLNKTLADLNFDGANVYGRDDNHIQVIGYGYTTLEDLLRDVASKQGRDIVPNGEPEKGEYFRSDQFSFAKSGIPALYTSTVTRPDEDDFTAKRYHKPSDEYDPKWNMTIAAKDADAFLQVGVHVANGEQWPQWKPTAEFHRKTD
ncbi:MAG TPA: M28 family metallopeptidase [Terriglobia bacterium]|jgi:Zn-dependent M28 family amino/carboxypeptidase